MRATFALLASLLVIVTAAPALADDRVIVLDEIVLTGSPQRPNAFYVLERAEGRTEVVDLRTTFTGEIIRDAEGLDR